MVKYNPSPAKMVKYAVRPMLNLRDGKDVSASVHVSWAHNDNELSVRVQDSAVKDGFDLNGVSLGLKSDRVGLVYHLGSNDARLRLSSHVDVRDKTVNLTYRSHLNSGAATVEASLQVDDDNKAAVVYDLAAFAADHRRATLKWTHTRGDLELTPAYNLGSEALTVSAKYRLDAENSLKATFDVSSNEASLQWANNGGIGGDGELRVTARANLGDSNAMKQVPSLVIEKTFDVDV